MRAVYRFLALTKVYIPFFEKAYVYIPTLVGPVMLLVTIYLSFFTRFGRTVYAIGNNRETARLSGINVVKTKMLVFGIMGLLAGVAGLFFPTP